MDHIERTAARRAASDNLRQAVAGKAERILRRREVLARVGISQSTLYAWMADGTFPRPVALGAKMVGWKESEIDFWIESRDVRGAE